MMSTLHGPQTPSTVKVLEYRQRRFKFQVRSCHHGMPRPQNGNEGDVYRYRGYLESRTQPRRGSPHLEVGRSDESSTARTNRLGNIKQDLDLGRIKSRMER